MIKYGNKNNKKDAYWEMVGVMSLYRDVKLRMSCNDKRSLLSKTKEIQNIKFKL